MADGILGLGSGQASSLNSDLIEKLKTAEKKSTVEPIETKITKITTEKETFASVETKRIVKIIATAVMGIKTFSNFPLTLFLYFCSLIFFSPAPFFSFFCFLSAFAITLLPSLLTLKKRNCPKSHKKMASNSYHK